MRKAPYTLIDGEFRTYRSEDPEVQQLQSRMPAALFEISAHLLDRWQDAGLPLRPTAHGFALQAPVGEHLQSIAWIYGPDARHVDPRVEVGLDLLRRRGVPDNDLLTLRDRLEFYRDSDEVAGLVSIVITSSMSAEDADRLIGALIQFAHSLS